MKKNLPYAAFLFSTAFLHAQIHQFEAEHFSGAQGLSQHYIYSILQDYRGFIWFGTKDGLNRFDGYTFKVYRNDPLDPTTISDNYVLNIYEDRDSNLWIGTASGGLNKFNRSTETFTRCQNTVRDSATHSYLFIDALLKDDDGKLWLGTSGQGLWRYDPATSHIERLLPLAENSPLRKGNAAAASRHASEVTIVQRIYQDREKRIWLTAADAGLILAKDKNGTMPFKSFPLYKDENQKPDSVIVNHIFQSRSGTLWVGTSEGLGALNPETGECKYYSFERGRYSAVAVSHINETEDGSLWLNCRGGSLSDGGLARQTEGGLAKFNPSNGEYSIVVSRDEGVQKSLKSISWFSVDRSGVLWIGTGGYGILKYNPAIERFGKQRKSLLSFLLKEVFRISSVSHPLPLTEFVTPRSIIQEADSTLWISLDRNGIAHYSLRTHRVLQHFTSINFPEKERVPMNTGGRLILGQMMKHSSGELWIGTNGGILRMNTVSGSFKYLSLYPNPDSSNVWLNSTGYPDITCLFEDVNNVVWAGTPSLGLIRVDPNDYSTILFQHNVRDPNSLSNNSILSIEQDPFDKNVLWIGTDGGGLNKFDTFNKKFRRIQERDGLPNNVVYSVLSDQNGNLWMSTNKGIARYSISSDKFRTFTFKQGLQDNEFNRFEYFRDLNGSLYFGGINGCNAFTPALLKDNTTVPSVVLTDFRLFNESVSLKKEHSPLSTSITETQKLMLEYSQNVITFEFAALEFSSPMNNNYAYRLSGFDRDWVYCGPNRTVTYTNLDPGEYVFQVKGANNDGVWNETGMSLAVIVTPPIWMTWWFRTIAGIILLTVVGGTIRAIELRKYREQMRRKEQETALERERLRIARDMHDDLGARLTEIGMIGDLARRDDADSSTFRKQIGKMTDVARETVAVFDEIVWAVNPKYDRIDHVANYFSQYAVEYLSSADIRCKLEIPETLPDAPVAADVRHNLFMIFKEALNNTVKHAQAATITVRYIVDNESLQLSIIDDGKGFDANSEKIYSEGLESMKQRAEKIHSSILIRSSEGKGTAITVIVSLYNKSN